METEFANAVSVAMMDKKASNFYSSSSITHIFHTNKIYLEKF
ncbi:MAG TPA: hypothetical protein VE595_00375 [Nitrososphaeraceae archaeon]|nr:hypothetical protein [Nitrososphaeraceae archaeon]